jgi:phosphonopyruvate decarboxylase
MMDPALFYQALLKRGITFFTGVPDSLLKSICGYIADHSPKERHVIAANEGGAVGIAAGYHMATGQIPLVYMQNSGLGNTINPLTSLVDKEVYAIPMLLLIGWRGEPGVKDEPQHVKQGRISRDMLETLELPYAVLPDELDAGEKCLDDLISRIRQESAPGALLVPSTVFSPYAYKMESTPEFELTREAAIKAVLGAASKDDVVVGTTGMPSREIFEHRKHTGQGHAQDFLTVGAMGHASQIALGIAMNRPEKRVLCLDGDGAALMHLGGMAIVGTHSRQGNFRHIVLNNGAHDSVGGQPTAAFKVDLATIAKSCGYRTIERADSLETLRNKLPDFLEGGGPSFLEIRICKGNRKDLGRPTTSPLENKRAFMEFLGSPPSGFKNV